MYKFQIQQIDVENRKAVLIGTISFVDLLNKVRFSYREEESDESMYQRRTEPERVKSIAKYIYTAISSNRDKLPIFPTSIILAIDNEDLNFNTARDGDETTINELPDGILIVDGQHRMAGMEYLYKRLSNQNSLFVEETTQYKVNYIREYRFNCTILVNYDLWEQARIFANVNFNQKKVNKSLFYDIYGFLPPDKEGSSISKQNEIYLAHKLVSFLNSNENSPFRGFVNMLGTGDGYISQAFLVEQLIKLMTSSGIWADVVTDLKNNSPKRLYNYAAAELSAFLGVVRFTFNPFWPEDGNVRVSVLCKTTGIGALFRFLKDLHNNMSSQLLQAFKSTPGDVITYAQVVDYFSKEINPLKKFGEYLFSSDSTKGKFNGTGGSGLQSKLYREIFRLWSENR